MAEWFFRKKSKGEVERDPGWDECGTEMKELITNCDRIKTMKHSPYTTPARKEYAK